MRAEQWSEPPATSAWRTSFGDTRKANIAHARLSGASSAVNLCPRRGRIFRRAARKGKERMSARNLLITGSSRGIGAAAALAAGRDGWNVAVNYRQDRGAAEKLVASLEAMGRKAVAIQADVGVEVDVQSLFERTVRALGPIGGVVVNAGMTGRKTRVDEFDTAQVKRLFDVNALGPLMCCREAAKRMSKRRGGSGGPVVVVTSITAVSGGAGFLVPYAASKGAANTLVAGFAREVAAEGIRVNGVLPGVIDTEIHATTGIADGLPAIAAQIPLGRLGTAEEVAEAIVWLLSERSSYVLGAIVPVTGGR
jgi:NAD(P)-dependent dehydrogenase (short-subunit alcohol dehydrogenase family)